MEPTNVLADDIVDVPAVDPLEMELSLGEIGRPPEEGAPLSVVSTTSVMSSPRAFPSPSSSGEEDVGPTPDITIPCALSVGLIQEKLCNLWSVPSNDLLDAENVFAKPRHSQLLLRRSSSPFWKAFLSLPSLIANALVNMGVFPVEQDAQLLLEMFADDFMCDSILQEITSVHGFKLNEPAKLSAIKQLVCLLRSVLASLGDTDSSGYPQYL